MAKYPPTGSSQVSNQGAGFGLAPMKAEGSVVSYDESQLQIDMYGRPYILSDQEIVARGAQHAVDIDIDTITLTEEEQND